MHLRLHHTKRARARRVLVAFEMDVGNQLDALRRAGCGEASPLARLWRNLLILRTAIVGLKARESKRCVHHDARNWADAAQARTLATVRSSTVCARMVAFRSQRRAAMTRDGLLEASFAHE